MPTDRLPKIVWNATNSAKAYQILGSEISLDLSNEVLLVQEAAAAIDSFEKLTAFIISELGVNHRPAKLAVLTLNRTWFDNECRQMKETVRNLFKQYRNSHASEILARYFQTKEQFRTLFKDKRAHFVKKQFQQFTQEIDLKSSRQFWNTLAGILHPEGCDPSVILVHLWEQHFSALFFDTNCR